LPFVNRFFRNSFLLFFLCLSIPAQAQDEIEFMFYNLLNFPSDNPVNRQDTLKKILDLHPVDVLMVCELKSESGADQILNEVLNTDGVTHYARAAYVSQQSDPKGEWKLQQLIFYNSEKLTLLNQLEVLTLRRDLNIYQMEVQVENEEPVPLDIVVTHFKSSQGFTNENIRLQAAERLVDYLAEQAPNLNLLFAGDFNVYSSQEPAYQTLLDATNNTKLQDPIASPGSWHTNTSFKDIHTQSTRNSSLFGDGSGGGLDDRFDFILLSESIMSGNGGLKYVDGSYDALGNNNDCYNQSLIFCENQSLDPELIPALYYMSDHLPVILKLESSDIISSSPSVSLDESFSVRAEKGDLLITLEEHTQSPIEIAVWDIYGRMVTKQSIDPTGSIQQKVKTGLPRGQFIVQVTYQGSRGTALIQNW